MRDMAKLSQLHDGAPRYLALIGDIRGSRHLDDRQGVQERLRADLATLEQRFAADLAAGFVITTGDEFQALLADPAAGVPVVIACDTMLSGLRLRYGLGWGTLSTRLEERAVGMDGPCFHAARQAIETAKAKDRWLAVRGLPAPAESVLDALLDLIAAVRAGWTSRQAEAVARRRELATQRELAQRLHVDPSTVSKRLKSALYDEITAAERAASDLLVAFARGEVAGAGHGSGTGAPA
jgi:hypothetical protein